MNGKGTVRASLLLTATIAMTLALSAQPAAAAATSSGLAGSGAAGFASDLVSDFNGDGFGDLAVGTPRETVGDVAGAGAVNVLYGSSQGLTSDGNQLLHQGNCLDSDPGYDGVGAALAFGDFDGDGFDDLAIGAPYQKVGDAEGAGAVHIVHGSANGLQCARQQYWNQDSGDIGNSQADTGDEFGTALAAGDLNDDGADDLAIGVPREGFADIPGAGVVHVLYGSGAGLTADDDQLWHQNISDVEGDAGAGDWYGTSLAIGDFGKTSHGDIAVGVPGDLVEGVHDAGAVNVLYGSDGGLTAAADQLWHQSITGVGGSAEVHDWFGMSLAAADFGRDGRADLAVGTPFENVAGVFGAGAVNVLYGTPNGLGVTGNQLWHQGLAGVLDIAEPGDYFGWALAAGNFNGSGPKDLAIGAHHEYHGGLPDTGAVNILYGSTTTGLTDVGDQFLWTGDTGTAAGGELFGTALAAANLGKGAPADLAIAAPYDDDAAGSIRVLYGSSAGLTTTGSQRWTQSSPGILDTAEPGELFGTALTASTP